MLMAHIHIFKITFGTFQIFKGVWDSLTPTIGVKCANDIVKHQYVVSRIKPHTEL